MMRKTPLILDGRAVRDAIRRRLKKKCTARARRLGRAPSLAIVQVGEDDASAAYIRQKVLFGKSIGVAVVHEKLPQSAQENEVAACIRALAGNPAVAGIILQLPVPPHLSRETLLNLIPLEKDVDGLSAASRARLMAGDASGFVPATARGVFELLSHYGISVAGKKVAVFGRSPIAGGPIAQLLSAKGARVSVVHSKTPEHEAQKLARAADIVVVAIGKARSLGPAYFRNDKTQVVVDVGINPVLEHASRVQYWAGRSFLEELPQRKLVGDVAYEEVAPLVAALSPVPGGVGPMTVAALFENLYDASVSAPSQGV